MTGSTARNSSSVLRATFWLVNISIARNTPSNFRRYSCHTPNRRVRSCRCCVRIPWKTGKPIAPTSTKWLECFATWRGTAAPPSGSLRVWTWRTSVPAMGTCFALMRARFGSISTPIANFSRASANAIPWNLWSEWVAAGIAAASVGWPLSMCSPKSSKARRQEKSSNTPMRLWTTRTPS